MNFHENKTNKKNPLKIQTDNDDDLTKNYIRIVLFYFIFFFTITNFFFMKIQRFYREKGQF